LVDPDDFVAGWPSIQVELLEVNMDRLLTVAEAADALNTSQRFVRRIVDERRIKFVRVGRHVRIPEAALAGFVEAGTVEPAITRPRRVVA
jgi:excisionase family DNA binding protein